MRRTHKGGDVARQTWEQQVGEVFDLRPRNRYAHKLWLQRPEEGDLHSALLHPVRHVCVDGPSGSGKTSLALTARARAGLRFKYVRLAKSTTWKGFCKKLVTKRRRARPKLTVGAKGGLLAGLPAFEGEVKLELEPEEGRTASQIAAEWTVADACEAILDQQVSLIIDDVERASKTLVSALADLAKEMLTESLADQTKLIFVGTDDVYDRLIRANSSLETRMRVISLGAFPSSWQNNASWTYLVRGFEKLSKTHYPGSKALWASRARAASPESKADFEKERDACIQAVFHAADGLPKSLTELGYEVVAGTEEGAVTIGASSVLEEARKMLQANVDRLRAEYPRLQGQLKTDTYARKVFAQLLLTGTGRIHSENRTVTDLAGLIPESEVREAISKLIDLGILVRTGEDRDHLFFSDLEMAHTLSVLSVNRSLCERLGINPRIFEPVGQLMLELGWDERSPFPL